MRINELLNESQQTELSEGPRFNKFGQAVGNVAGMAAKGAGAVAGGIAGLGAAAKKGFAAGKQQVAGGGDEAPSSDQSSDQQAAPADSTAGDGQQAGNGGSNTTQQTTTTTKSAATPDGKSGPIAPPGAGMVQSIKNAWNKYQPKKPSTTQTTTQTDTDGAAPTTASDINAAGPKGTAAAKQQTGAAGAAIDKTAAATQNKSADQAGQTVYAQVKSQINNLDKKGKQRILQLLQKSLQQPGPADQKQAAPAAAAPAAPAAQAEPTAQTAPAPEAPDDQGRIEPTMEPASTGRKQGGGRVKGQQSQTPGAIRKREKRQAAAAENPKKGKGTAKASQAEIDADRNRIMGNFTDSVERHKQRMVAESIAQNTFSIFRK